MSYVKKTRKQRQIKYTRIIKNSDIESMLDLNKLICKIKKYFIEYTLDAEFDEHIKTKLFFHRTFFNKCFSSHGYGIKTKRDNKNEKE